MKEIPSFPLASGTKAKCHQLNLFWGKKKHSCNTLAIVVNNKYVYFPLSRVCVSVQAAEPEQIWLVVIRVD